MSSTFSNHHPGGKLPRLLRSRARRLFPSSVQGVMLLLLLIVLLPHLLVEGRHYASVTEERRAQELQMGLEQSRHLAAAVDAQLRDILRHEETLGTALISPQTIPAERASSFLAAIDQQYSFTRYHWWLDPRGRVVASSQPATVGQEIGDASYVRTILAGTDRVLSDLFQDPDGDAPTFVVGRGIRGAGGALLGIMVVAVDPTGLGEALTPERTGRGNIAVVDRRGWLVYRRPEVELSWEQRNWRQSRPVISAALNGQEAAASYLSPRDGQEQLGAAAPVRSAGWAVLVSRPTGETLAPVRRVFFRELGESLLVTAMAVVAALAIGRYITIPMRRLREHAAALGRGVRGRRVGVGGPRELEELAQTFNQMADALQRHEKQVQRAQDELEARIEERTWALARTNEELEAEIAERRKAEEERAKLVQRLQDVNAQLTVSNLRTQAQAEALRDARDELETHVAERTAELSRTNQALRASEERYRTLAEAAHDAIFVVDRDGVFRYINTFAARQLEVRPDDLIGKRQNELFPPDAGVRQWDNLCTVFDTGQSIYVEDRLPFPGREAWFGTWLVPLRDEAGAVYAALGVSRDITDRKQTEEEREQLLTQVEQERQRMEEMLHLISHDLRNPLSGIHGRAELLQRLLEQLDPGSIERKSVDAIIAASRRMNTMIQELVESTRLESGQLQIHRQSIDLASLVSEIVERAVTPEERPRVRVEGAPHMPTIPADPDRIERAIANIITNALKYSPSESPVIVRVAWSGDEAVISVSDRGVGIPPEQLPHVFERFYRVTGGKGVAQHPEGLGLGLYIARLIVEAHGGRIWAVSEPGKGSTFTFTLAA